MLAASNLTPLIPVRHCTIKYESSAKECKAIFWLFPPIWIPISPSLTGSTYVSSEVKNVLNTNLERSVSFKVNKTSVKGNILTIKQNTSGSRSR